MWGENAKDKEKTDATRRTNEHRDYRSTLSFHQGSFGASFLPKTVKDPKTKTVGASFGKEGKYLLADKILAFVRHRKEDDASRSR